MAASSKAFTRLLTPDQARQQYAAALHIEPRGTERIRIEHGLGRVLAEDLIAATDLPPFDRSAVDGWAVRAGETAGASPDRPVELRAAGEVRMGTAAEAVVASGSAVRVPTGGMIPPGSDAVVMQEYVEVRAERLLIGRAARPGDNVVERGIDVRAGEVVLKRGRRLRSSDLGILAGQGRAEVDVVLPPRVAIMATGDEVVPPGQPIKPGQVRDMNSAALAGAVQAAGGTPLVQDIVQDEQPLVEAALRRAVAAAEMVLISGGSSVGERDVVAEAIAALGPPGIVVHGVSVRPGKPTVLAAAGSIPIIGLPGNPVSALVIFDLFARPVLEQMLGADRSLGAWNHVQARLTAALPSAGEREDHRRVRLEFRDDGIWATPLPAGSQVLTSLVRADGIVAVPPGAAFEAGAAVRVRLIP